MMYDVSWWYLEVPSIGSRRIELAGLPGIICSAAEGSVGSKAAKA